MSKKSITIILCLVLIATFFLPYLSNDAVSYSGWSVMFGNKEVEGINAGGKSLFLCLLIPVGALLVLLEKFVDGYSGIGIVRWMPLVGVAYLLLMLYFQMSGHGSFGKLISFFDYGLWITAVASILLPFIGD